MQFPQIAPFLSDFIDLRAIHIHLQLMLGPNEIKKKVKKALLMTTIIESALMIVIFLEISQTPPDLALLEAEIVK